MAMKAPVEAFPLQWPAATKRRKVRERGAFSERGKPLTIGAARKRLLKELRLLRCSYMVLNSNLALKADGMPYSTQPEPQDPGVAVYFALMGEPYCLPCDKWKRAADNIAAIAKYIEAMRGQLRWGVVTVKEAFAGFKALPPAADPDKWWVVLGVHAQDTNIRVRNRYRELAKEHHPDVGGDTDTMARITKAYEDYNRERML